MDTEEIVEQILNVYKKSLNDEEIRPFLIAYYNVEQQRQQAEEQEQNNLQNIRECNACCVDILVLIHRSIAEMDLENLYQNYKKIMRNLEILKERVEVLNQENKPEWEKNFQKMQEKIKTLPNYSTLLQKAMQQKNEDSDHQIKM